MELPKLDEHILMQNSELRTIETPINRGATIKWHGSWDYKSNLNETIFKTLTRPPYQHKLIESTEVDLNPVANIKFYIVKIKRF
jgi:hypothetical protein